MNTKSETFATVYKRVVINWQFKKGSSVSSMAMSTLKCFYIFLNLLTIISNNKRILSTYLFCSAWFPETLFCLQHTLLPLKTNQASCKFLVFKGERVCCKQNSVILTTLCFRDFRLPPRCV
jgi:hypothetical protein